MSEPTKPAIKPLAQALSLAWELGYTIAVPLVVFALGGRLLDRAWGTSPWLLLTGVLLSIAISTALVLRKMQSIMAAAQPPEPTTPKVQEPPAPTI